MYLTFTNEAKQRLARYVDDSKKMLMDYDDGVGPFSAIGNCSLDDNFKLIFVDKDRNFKDFDAHFDSNLGPIYYKGYTKPQFDEQMTVRFNPNVFTMPLTTPKGTLTDDIEVVDLSNGNYESTTMNQTHDF